MYPTKFVEKYDLYRSEEHRAAERALETIHREGGIEIIRLVWPDQHGQLRGKALTAPAFANALDAGNDITMAPFFFDTADAIVLNPFTPRRRIHHRGSGGQPPTSR